MSNALGTFVDSPDLRLGFAIWEIASDGGSTLIEADDVPQMTGTTSYAVETVLNQDTHYRWRGRAVLTGGYGPWSAWASFRTVPPPPQLPADSQARYITISEAAWSAATHPQDFPANPHFSPMIGATHLAGTRLWEPGGPASEGIERMAEEGSVSPLDAEIAAAQAAGQAETLIRGGGLSPSPGTETVEFDITTAFPYVNPGHDGGPQPRLVRGRLCPAAHRQRRVAQRRGRRTEPLGRRAPTAARPTSLTTPTWCRRRRSRHCRPPRWS